MFNLPCFCFSTGQGGDTDSFHASMWDEERSRRQTIHFAFPEEDEESVWDAADIYISFILQDAFLCITCTLRIWVI